MSSFATRFDAQSRWRRAVRERVGELARFIEAHELADDASRDSFAGLSQRLASDKLVVAFVAEFSRGKSELINAIFFGDTGRRVLPATPGRTTMCPVELAYDAAEPPSLALLPIATRHEGLSLAELRRQPARWSRAAIDLARPDALPQALLEVTRTVAVSLDDARQLGFWDDERPDDNPPRDAAGRVTVPAWRHALINYPHPLLSQGLVVIDTPGLNAIGTEPELTLGLLPSAHAAVFVLGADTGVTRSDLGVWRDHLGARGLSRFVVLNKIDALADPLLAAADVAAQIDSQCRTAAAGLGVPALRVFALSARRALAGRVSGDAAAVAGSGIAKLEQALAAELLPQRRTVLSQHVAVTVRRLEADTLRRLTDERRQLAEQVLELRSLRGRNGARVQQLLSRVEADAAGFEQCTSRLQALRAVHGRMLNEALAELASDRLRNEVARLQSDIDASLLNMGARRAFVDLCVRLRGLLDAARRRDQELRDMMAAQFVRLNADFAFGLVPGAGADWGRFADELDSIERNYAGYLGLSQALRLAQPKFREQFRRMLVSKLRVVFETAGGEVELWSKTASAQLDAQLRDRRRGYRKRRETLQRITEAAGELDQRIDDIERQDRRLLELRERIGRLVDAVCAEASGGGERGRPEAVMTGVADVIAPAAAPETAPHCASSR